MANVWKWLVHLAMVGGASGMGSLPAEALGRRLVPPMCLTRVHGRVWAFVRFKPLSR